VLKRKLIFSVIILVMVSIVITINFRSKNGGNKDIRVQDYFPRKTMIKQFSGGFENGGYKHIIDKIDKDKIQVKQLDTATATILIYQVSENDIRLIFRNEEPDGKFKKDYIGIVKPNVDEIILKSPLEVGTQWTDNSDGKYEITGINIGVKTPVDTFSTVEVTLLKGGSEVKMYYGKDLGLVEKIIKGYREDELIKVEQ
jgi:uncharacterized ubiquitin-like protein YukD